MTILRFNSWHWDRHEMFRDIILGNEKEPDFRKTYESYDFACDIPHAYFFREISKAYPGLTVNSS
jgi:Sulfotransferase domain